MSTLTKKQKQVFDFINTYIAENGISPTMDEIRINLKLKAVSTIHEHILSLQKKGFLFKEVNSTRGILPKKEIKSIIEIPILGRIKAGYPLEAIEEKEGTISIINNKINSPKDYYALRVVGDSMIDDGIFDGDIVIIKKQSTADDGQTVVAIIDENEATLKKIYREKNQFRLEPRNPNMLPFFRKEVEIRGIVIEIIRNIETSNIYNLKKYNDLKSFFDKLNFQKEHFVNSNDICTPMGCVEEMVNMIPEDFWLTKGLKILDPCAGNGNFHAYIATKTNLNNLYFNEINKKRINNIKKIFGDSAKITDKDFLLFDEKEEYDLVVANPPYAKFTNGERTAKNHNLSRDFILKALNVTKKDGYILFIAPDNWMSYADNNKIPEILSKYQFIYLNIHGAKKWFPGVGSSFTWFLVKKSPNLKKFTISNHYKMPQIDQVLLEKNTKFIPLYYSNLVKSIINKTINSEKLKYKIQTSSNLHKYTKKEYFSKTKDSKFKYKIHHTPSQTIWSKSPHIYQNGWKVFISLTNQYSTFIDECGMTQSIAFIRCSSKKEAEEISLKLNNPVYLFLNNITRYGNFNNIRVLQNFPVYTNFKFTKEEKDLIKKFNNLYYNKNRARLFN